MTRNQANEAMQLALKRIGIHDAHSVKMPMSIRVASFGNRGWINVDLMILDQQNRRNPQVKICMYVEEPGRKHINGLVKIGHAIKGVVLEQGSQYGGIQNCGVVYKLNTGVNWKLANTADFDSVAKIVGNFIKLVTSLLG